MRFDLHIRSSVREEIERLAQTMSTWEAQPRADDRERAEICERLQFFEHTSSAEDLFIGGADGSGDYPALCYADSFVYFTVAQGTIYRSDRISGLKEVSPAAEPVFDFTWLPEEESARRAAFDEALGRLASLPVRDAVKKSDYRKLKSRESGESNTTDSLVANLIRPHAADSGNLGIQLRSTAELGAALRLIQQAPKLHYVLMDGTFSLPFVGRKAESLFHEHLKRLCCVEARERGIGLFAISKSPGLPGVEVLEELAREKAGLEGRTVAEHWYVRLPVPEMEDWALGLATGRRLPPPGAVTYLVRFHRTTPVLRLDMDRQFWQERVLGSDQDETRIRERRIFQDLDYASHDQRCYGYPYPIKAGHDRASLTQAERVALRKLIMDAAVRAGMRRSLFRDAAHATGHG
jgi:hypothetical protein